jgi:putative ABC transport system permease protein
MQNLKVALFLASKSIARGNKGTMALIIFIMSLSFINLVFIASILNGIVETINGQVVNNLTAHIVIDPQEEPNRKDLLNHAGELQAQVEKLPGVISTASHYKLSGTLAFDKNKNGKFKYIGGAIIGVDPEKEKLVTDISRHIVSGQYLDETDTDKILLGVSLAGDYPGVVESTSLEGVKVGNKVRVTFTNGVERTYTVKGLFNAKFDMVDMNSYISKKEAESILSTSDNASQILIKINPASNTDIARGKLANDIRSIAQITEIAAPNVKVREWPELLGPLAGIASSFGIITAIVSGIALLVAAVTIFIMIYINAINKKRQIGILKAIGIEESIIIYSYIFQAFFYAIFGTAIGLILFYYAVQPFFIAHPISLPMGDTYLVLSQMNAIFSVSSLILAALIAGFIPAWKITKINILEAIWGA